METVAAYTVVPGVEHVETEPLGATISNAQTRIWRMKQERERIIHMAIGDWREMVKELEEAICYAELSLTQSAAQRLTPQ